MDRSNAGISAVKMGLVCAVFFRVASLAPIRPEYKIACVLAIGASISMTLVGLLLMVLAWRHQRALARVRGAATIVWKYPENTRMRADLLVHGRSVGLTFEPVVDSVHFGPLGTAIGEEVVAPGLFAGLSASIEPGRDGASVLRIRMSLPRGQEQIFDLSLPDDQPIDVAAINSYYN